MSILLFTCTLKTVDATAEENILRHKNVNRCEIRRVIWISLPDNDLHKNEINCWIVLRKKVNFPYTFSSKTTWNFHGSSSCDLKFWLFVCDLCFLLTWIQGSNVDELINYVFVRVIKKWHIKVCEVLYCLIIQIQNSGFRFEEIWSRGWCIFSMLCHCFDEKYSKPPQQRG